MNKNIFAKKFGFSLLFFAIFGLRAFSQEILPPNAQFDDFFYENDDELAPNLDAENFSQQETQITIIESRRVHELNPQITSYSHDSTILGGLYEGLFSYNPVTLEPIFAVAADYKISRDKKRWSFALRDDAKFSNGEKITAASVRDSWLRLLATPNAPYSSLLDIIRNAQEFRNGECSEEEVGIYAASETKLSVYLTKPANYFAKVLCHSAFSVVHSDPNVYSGAYALDSVNRNGYVLKKNPHYWDSKNVLTQKIVFLQSDDKDENAYLYNTGAADWITANVDTNKIIDKEALQINAEFGTTYYFFKTSNKKSENYASENGFNVWDYAEFRNAALEAFPWEIMRKNASVAAETFVYPLGDYPKPEGFSFTDELEASLKMKNARKKYGVPQEQILSLNFLISQYTLTEEAKQAFYDALLPLGIELVFTEVSSHDYVAEVAKSNADLFVYSWIGDFADPLAFLELFRGNSSLNESGWKNDDFDALLDEAAVVPASERLSVLAKAENILLDEGMVIPILHPVCFNLIDLKDVGGWITNAFDVHPLKYIYKKPSRKSNSKNPFTVRFKKKSREFSESRRFFARFF